MTVPLSEAKSRLEELIAQLRPGEELVLTDGTNRPIARVVGGAAPATGHRALPELRHYSVVPVCLAVAGVSAAACALAGWQPLVGFACGLVASVVACAAAFALARPEAQ